MFQSTKPLWQSRTLMAAGAGGLTVLAEALWNIQVSEAEVISAADNALALAAFAGTIWGRIKARRRLT